MKKPLTMLGLAGTLTCVLLILGQRAEPTAAEGTPADPPQTRRLASKIPAREKPFWDNAQAFVDAYAKQDAVAIGKLFTKNAEFYDEFGERTVGRDAIVKMFQDVFDTSPEARENELHIDRIRFITDTVALEEGTVKSTPFQNGPVTTTHYIALHVRGRDGVWRINVVKDRPPEKATRSEQLGQLSWLVGEWVSEESTSVVHSNCRWSNDGNYLLRRFTVQTEKGASLNGVQRIGWDPVRRQIRSWVFDSSGGYVEGTWKRNGNQWLVTSSGFNAQGETASGVAVYMLIDAERITWQYRSLVVGNELREDIKPVVMTRRPPAPGKGR